MMCQRMDHVLLAKTNAYGIIVTIQPDALISVFVIPELFDMKLFFFFCSSARLCRKVMIFMENILRIFLF